MKKSEIILISRGEYYKYVRDVVTDNHGEATKFYGYRGNARQRLSNLNYTNGMFRRETGLKRGITYTINIQVNAEVAATESSVKFGEFQDFPFAPVTFEELYNRLNRVAPDRFSFEWDDIDRDTEGFYFVAKGNMAGTSIAVTAGSSNDLLAALGATVDTELASDNLFDQTGAGKVYGDYTSLVTSFSGADSLITFPESTPTTELVRVSTDAIGTEGSLSVNTLSRASVENIRIIEVDVTVRE